MTERGGAQGKGSTSKWTLAVGAALLVVVGLVMVLLEPWAKEPAAAASGGFARAWGKDVDAVAPGNGFEICTIAANCKIGAATNALGGEFDDPISVAADSAGNVYVADGGNRRVEKFDSAGNFQRTWGKNVIQEGAPGDTAADEFEVCTAADDCRVGDDGGFGGEFRSAAGIAVDGADNIYVSDLVPPMTGGTARVQKFDSSGNFQRLWGRDVVQEDQSGDVDPDGFEICTNPDFCQTGDEGTLGGEMNDPAAVGADAGGNVYVADEQNSRIQRFSSSGAFLAAWGGDVIQEGRPGDTPTDRFEVCTTAADCKIGVTGGQGGELNVPDGVAADDSGNVYVADTLATRIQKFDSSGAWKRAWGMDVVQGGVAGFEICTVAANCKPGTHGGLGGELVFPHAVAVDAGIVYVSDSDNNRIQRFDSSGNFQRAWGRDVIQGGATGFEVCTVPLACKAGAVGAHGGEMNAPNGLWSHDSHLYLADEGNLRVQAFGDLPAPPGGGTVPVTPSATPTAAPPTGQRAAALKKCKRKKTAKKRKKCKKKAMQLPL